MDDDELMGAWIDFVIAQGSDEAASIAIDADASWFDMDEYEVEDLLNAFSDEVGWGNVQRVCQIVLGGQEAVE